MNKILSAVIILAVILIVAALVVFLVAREKFDSCPPAECPPCTSPGCQWQQCPARGYCVTDTACQQNCKTDCATYCPCADPDPSTFCPPRGYRKRAGVLEPFCHCDPGWEGDSCKTENSTYGCDAKGACNPGPGSQTLAACRAGCKVECPDCGCDDWEKYCLEHDFFDPAECAAKCKEECSVNCPCVGPDPNIFCPANGYDEKYQIVNDCPHAGPIVNCDPSSSCAVTPDDVKIIDDFQDPLNPSIKWVLIYGCGVAYQIQNSYIKPDGWMEPANCIRDGIVDGKCSDPNCPCDPGPTCGCVLKKDTQSWDKTSLARMLTTLRSMYSMYQEIFGVIKPGSLKIKGEKGLYINYIVEYLDAGGQSGPGFSGALIGPDFFRSVYQANQRGENRLEHIFFYETTRNFMFYSNRMEYSHPDDPNNWGWVNQAFMDVMGCLISLLVPAVFYYAGQDRDAFIKDRTDLLDVYLNNPGQWNFQNTFNQPATTLPDCPQPGSAPCCTPPPPPGACAKFTRVPFSLFRSLNDLYAGILSHLYLTYGEFPWLRKFMKSFLILPVSFTSATDNSWQIAVDNYYLASSRAVQPAGQDLIGFFGQNGKGSLRWPISAKAQNQVQAFMALPDQIYYFGTGVAPISDICMEADAGNIYVPETILNYQFFSTQQECSDALAKI